MAGTDERDRATESSVAGALSEVPAAFMAEVCAAVIGDKGMHSYAAASLAPIDVGAAAENWQARLGTHCSSAGLAVREVSLSWQQARSAASPGIALATWAPRTGWLALLDASADRVQIVTSAGASRWVSAELLGDGAPDAAELEAARDWVLIEAGLSAASSREQHKLSPLQRLIEIVRPDRPDLLAIVLYAVFIGLLSLAIPIAVQQLVNSVALGGLVQPVVVLALLLFLGLTFAASLSAVQAFLAEMLQRRIFVRSCNDLANRLPRVDFEAFAGKPGPEWVNRFFDIVTLQKTGARLLLDGAAVLLQTTAGLLILSLYHPLMLGLSVVLIGAIALVAIGLGRGATSTAISESSAKYDLAAWLEELARHETAFRSVAGRNYARARADRLLANWLAARSTHYRIAFRQFAASLGLQVTVNTLVLALGGFLVVSGELTLGQLVAAELIVSAVVAGVARLGKQLESFYDLLAAVDKVGSLIDLPLERVRGERVRLENGGAGEEAPQGWGIDAREVKFGFGSRGVFDKLDLQVQPGEHVALCGPAGSGKSVLLDLLSGLRSPDAGSIAAAGYDLRDLSLESLREHVACVRSPEIFAGSIVDNVRVGRGDLGLEEIQQVLEHVSLLEEVRRLPDGLYTALSQSGAPLSQSGAMRLTLARAIVGKPALLLIDTSLDAVDPQQRKELLDLLLGENVPWTPVIASHQPDVISRCNRVVNLPITSASSAPAAYSEHEAPNSQ